MRPTAIPSSAKKPGLPSSPPPARTASLPGAMQTLTAPALPCSCTAWEQATVSVITPKPAPAMSLKSGGLRKSAAGSAGTSSSSCATLAPASGYGPRTAHATASLPASACATSPKASSPAPSSPASTIRQPSTEPLSFLPKTGSRANSPKASAGKNASSAAASCPEAPPPHVGTMNSPVLCATPQNNNRCAQNTVPAGAP